MVWRDELAQGRVLLREIIDLEGTYTSLNGGVVDHSATGGPIPSIISGISAQAAPASHVLWKSCLRPWRRRQCLTGACHAPAADCSASHPVHVQEGIP